jgi:hypothetical protein
MVKGNLDLQMPSAPERLDFRDYVCIPMLTAAQNSDGGWGYQQGKESATESTAWALLALASSPESKRVHEFSSPMQRGKEWLRAAQLPDHSWPAFAKLSEGSWVTSLAALALHEHVETQNAVAGAVEWLCKEMPGESKWWRQWMQRLFAKRNVVRQNVALRGWSWTPGTSSWVEPTACALILMHQFFPPKTFPPNADTRRKLAEAMLYDRMCPGGGWNAGNPEVYGVAGEPLVGPTVWALIALQEYRERSENKMGLEWLLSMREKIQGPGSLALAHICFQVYGIEAPSIVPALREEYQQNQFLGSILVAASCALALDAPADWLSWERAG